MSSGTSIVQKQVQRARSFAIVAAAISAALLMMGAPAMAQRVKGIDVSAHQGNGLLNWTTLHNTNDRDFVFIRSSRGGTTGQDRRQGGYTPPNNTFYNLSQRYDDPYFVQNITGATSAGMLAGPYHYARADVIASTLNSDGVTTAGVSNTGTDEANHFLEMAGPWMRPGYMLPVYDLEAGQSQRTADELAQFVIDFSNRIHTVMGVRPIMYINGTYSQTMESSSLASQVVDAYPYVWDARYAYQVPTDGSDPFRPTSAATEAAIQTANPKDTFAGFYGPWDNSGVTHPWDFWQYASTARLSGYNNGNNNIDVNVSHGDMESLKDQLVPAVWMNNSSGEWTTLTNWNSGQTPVAPVQGPGQLARAGPMTLPTPRLPGIDDVARGVDGQNDTVILDRPSANITVTHSSGSHDIRKLIVRETLNITGGSLTVNYNPNYRPDNNPSVLHSGLLSAQFSANVSVTGGAALTVHTLQVDATRTLTLGNSVLTINRINLMPNSTTPAEIDINGIANFISLNNAAAVIANGAGAGSSGRINLVNQAPEGDPTINVVNGSAAVDLTISVPILGDGFRKSGSGTLVLNGANTYTGNTVVEGGKLSNSSAFLANAADVYLMNGTTLDLTFGAGSPDIIDSLFINGVSQASGIWGGVGSGAPNTTPFITGTGRLQVTTFIAPPLPGDFNEDGVVDAADYVEWRKNEGTTNTLPNDNGIGGTVGSGHYALWRANFGETAGSGAGIGGEAAIPEPASVALVTIAFGMLHLATSRRRRQA